MTPNPQNAYLQASVQTASPERLLVMLVDRLVRDVEQAVDALEGGRTQESHQHFLHAQDIVAALQSSLKPELWDGAEALNSVYAWLLSQLVRANVEHSTTVAAHCLDLSRQVADTWRTAALEVARRSA
jgi:flagellar protein FliS